MVKVADARGKFDPLTRQLEQVLGYIFSICILRSPEIVRLVFSSYSGLTIRFLFLHHLASKGLDARIPIKMSSYCKEGRSSIREAWGGLERFKALVDRIRLNWLTSEPLRKVKLLAYLL